MQCNMLQTGVMYLACDEFAEAEDLGDRTGDVTPV